MAKTHLGEKSKTLAKKKNTGEPDFFKYLKNNFVFDLYFHDKHFFLEEEAVQVGHMVSRIE